MSEHASEADAGAGAGAPPAAERWGPRPEESDRRAVLRALAADGDAGDLATFLLAEGVLGPIVPGAGDEQILGRNEDLLGQDQGTDLLLIGWIAALANGVTQAEGIEDWALRAVPEAITAPGARRVLWSELRRGDLVVARGAGPLRAAVMLDELWGMRIGDAGLERVALVDLVGAGDGPYVLRDKLWFWASYGAATPPDHLHHGASEPPTAVHVPPNRSGLWLAAAAVLAMLAGFLSLVLGGGSSSPEGPPMQLRDGLFPLDQLPLRRSTPGGTDLRWCTDGVPGSPYDGDLDGIRIRSVDVYGFDADTLLVDVSFLEPLDDTMDALERRAVRGYAVDGDGVAQGMVSVVETTPSGHEVRGRLTLDGALQEGSSGEVAVADHFQFFLELSDLGSPSTVRVAVDSFGGAPGPGGALPCHVMVADPVRVDLPPS